MTEPSPVPPGNAVTLHGLARAFVSSGLLSIASAEALSRQATAHGVSFIAELSAAGDVHASDVARTLSTLLGIPHVDLEALDPAQLPADLLDPKLCRELRIVVLGKRAGRLRVATADPTDAQTLDKVKFASQAGVDWAVADHDQLSRWFDEAARRTPAFDPAQFDFSDTDPTDGAGLTAVEANAIDDKPVVRFLNGVLLDACQKQASDVHFEPYEHSYRVRFRIDGQLREVAHPPPFIKDRLASRIKVLSRLDIAEKRVPQDGRMNLALGTGQAVDCRVSTLPTLFGEKIVIRLLDAGTARLDVDALGYEDEEKQRLLDAISRPHGMVLVTGPTGSGKTVSLYACLHRLNTPGVNIATAEDPAEIHLPGVNQVNVNDKAGLSFAAALRAFLRQDPDVLMVGEIRDLETADIATKAAQTGHLVLSTLHTNDAPSTLTRLRHMGMAPFNIASSVILIAAQRLARRLCAACRAPRALPRQSLHDAGFDDDMLDGSWQPYRPVGCNACHEGYRGRIGIHQVMPVSDAIRALILAERSATDIARQAEAEGVRSLRQSGLRKVRQGLTSLEEVMALTNA
ncbi:type IV-A pilus assembly ATPase PilB [Variovorax ginsengisoli]|uniref:Type IV pilus assembly protein PilB n=1 Tax=Variovorax ginsengisoli TaxID=363844 RepID=A0ABT9S5G4_9BURK|nr:type IV-A pilus assembly ATPase PilB [Variovorax ginsengisoli]MDP9898577.1 type IV pilus assembly protein PilB [Variovorax ginsengisoli]